MDDTLICDARIFPDLDSLSRAAAEETLRVVDQTVSQRGRCAIALAGGRTPARTYALLARDYADRMPWDRIHLFWGDERYVPPDDERSNYHMVWKALLQHVPLPPANIHPIPTRFERPDDAAKNYEATLRGFFQNDGPAFDLQFLGVGEEGHTASLFPGSPALEEGQRWVLAVRAPVEPALRLSLTLPVLNCARNTFFLVAGGDKRGIVEQLRRRPGTKPDDFPVSRVRPAGRVVWFLDQAASG